eukprot:69125_1
MTSVRVLLFLNIISTTSDLPGCSWVNDGSHILATDVCVTVAPGGTKDPGGIIAGFRFDCPNNNTSNGNVTARIYRYTDCTGSVILEAETHDDFDCTKPACNDNYVVFHNEYSNEGDCTVFGDWPLITDLCLPGGGSFYTIKMVNNNITGYRDAKFEYYNDENCTEASSTPCRMLSEFNYWCNNTDAVSNRTTAIVSDIEPLCPEITTTPTTATPTTATPTTATPTTRIPIPSTSGTCYYDPYIITPYAVSYHLMTYYPSTNTVYLFGGNTAPRNVLKLDMNYLSLGWIDTGEIMPRSNFYSEVNSIVRIDNIVYFIGAYDGGYDSGKMYKFDINSETFIDNSNIPLMPYPSIRGCVVTNMTHIFYVGGYIFSTKTLLKYVQIYDITANQWYYEEITLSPINNGWQAQDCSMIDNVLYVFGHSGDQKNIYKYISNSGWTLLSHTLSQDIESGFAIYSDLSSYNYVYIFGGHPTSNNVDVFDVNSEMVIFSTNIEYAVIGAYPLIISNKMYIFGGTNEITKKYRQRKYVIYHCKRCHHQMYQY